MEGLHTIISSNIRFDNPGDGILCWEMRRPLLTKILLSHRPLMIGTQEGRHSQHKELAESLSTFQLCDSHRPWLDERMYPCIYINPSNAKISKSGDAWLSDEPQTPGSKLKGSAFPRLCTWVRLTVEDKSLVIVNLHLDFLDSNTRMKQCEILCTEIRRQTTSDDRLIVMGDFNDHPGSQVHRRLLKVCPGLYDPWERPEEPSHHSFSGTQFEGHRIDWILLDERIKCEEIFLDKTNQGQLWPSDHFPLVCRFKL